METLLLSITTTQQPTQRAVVDRVEILAPRQRLFRRTRTSNVVLYFDSDID
jgi:hypothetical protein